MTEENNNSNLINVNNVNNVDKEKRIKNIIFIILLVSILCLVIYIFFYLKTENGKILSNPYGYPIQLLEEKNKAPVVCSCVINGKQPIHFLLTEKGIESQS